MKRTRAYTLTASLCVVAAAGCRGEPPNNPPPQDLAASPVDMAMTAEDMTADPPDFAGLDFAPPAAPTEFMVVRIGDGTVIPNGSAAPVFLEKRLVSDGTMVGTPLALPTAEAGAQKRLTLATTNITEGGLSRSADGRYVVLTGYNAMVGTLTVAGSMAATVNRVIGRIDAAGNIDTSTAAAFFDTTGPRSAASTDGTDLWAASGNGVIYTTLGSTAAPTAVLPTTANVRFLEFIGGQLYVSSGAGATRGINTVGTGAPKLSTTAARLSGFEAQTGNSYYGYVAFDRMAPPGIDTIYVADDGTQTATLGGVQRWSLNGTTWTYDGRMSMGLTTATGVRGLVGFRTATSVTLLATTAEGLSTPTRIVKFVDDGSNITQLTATEIVAGTLNNNFRGLAFAPQ